MWGRYLKTNTIYTIGSVANSAALFLLIPFLVNNLSTADYGAWAIYEILILLLNILISAGMDLGLMREYWFLESETDRRILNGTVLIAVTFWEFLLFGILNGGYSLISRLPIFSTFHLNSFPRGSLLLVYAISAAETIFSIFLAIFRIREQPVHYVALSIGKLLLFLISAIALLKMTGSINGALGGRLLADLIGIVAASLLSLRLISLKFEWHKLSRVLNYGLPFILANLSGYVLQNSDRYILTASSTLTIVAIYSLVYKLASSLNVFITGPFATDWAARRYRIALEDQAQKKYADVLLFYLFIGSLGMLGIIIISPLAYHFIAPASYWGGLQVLPVLLLAIFIYGLSYPLNVGLIIKDKTPLLAVIGIVSAIFCLGVEVILIPRFGMAGAAWSTFFSYLVWTVGITIFSLKTYPIPYQWGKILGVCGAAIIGYLGIFWINQSASSLIDSIKAMLLSLTWLIIVYGITGFTLIRRPAAKLAR